MCIKGDFRAYLKSKIDGLDLSLMSPKWNPMLCILLFSRIISRDSPQIELLVPSADDCDHLLVGIYNTVSVSNSTNYLGRVPVRPYKNSFMVY